MIVNKPIGNYHDIYESIIDILDDDFPLPISKKVNVYVPLKISEIMGNNYCNGTTYNIISDNNLLYFTDESFEIKIENKRYYFNDFKIYYRDFIIDSI